jgi:FlaA1/EpsC-like NDP-sugar epimerase
MKRQLQNYKLYLMISSDGAIVSTSLLLAFLFRFDFQLESLQIKQLYNIIPIAIVINTISFYLFGLYRGMWRYTTINDFWKLLHATIISLFSLVTVLLLINRFNGYSRSAFIIYFILLFLLTGSLRVLIRTVYINKKDLINNVYQKLIRKNKHLKNIIIIGAGDAGEKLVRELTENEEIKYNPIGFLDDNQSKTGRSIHGVRVLGRIDELPDLLVNKNGGISQAFIAIPSATGPQIRRIVDQCKSCNIEYKILPDLAKIVNGKVSVRQLRDVRYEDLLGREPIHLEEHRLRKTLNKKIILVTGAGGSIGSELCRQIVKYEPSLLLLLDSSEPNLYRIQMELTHKHKRHLDIPLLGKIQNNEYLHKVFTKYNPDIVFHAAAYKHVPMLENNPWEAVYNNIIGSKCLMETASHFNTGRFVLVSTDKAVRPTSVMGATKRATEIIMQSLSGKGITKFMAVRFGNVLGSSGSVVPLFIRQIARGGPVTVTHPEVTRFFMTASEACQLILQACAMGTGGEIFVLDMGTPVKISDMARDLIKLSGKNPEIDIEIAYTGLRPGEKLFEELITQGEDIVKTEHEKILVLRSTKESEYDSKSINFSELQSNLNELFDLASKCMGLEIKRKIKEIVPEYIINDSSSVL